MLPENASIRRYDRTDPAPHGVSDDRARMLLGFPPRTAAQVQNAIADAFNDAQAALVETVSDERMDEIENGTNKTPFKAYEYSAMMLRQAKRQPRAFKVTDAPQTSAIPSRRAVTRSHRHHRESEE